MTAPVPGPAIPEEAVEAAACALGGYTSEQYQRWRYTSTGQRWHDAALAALAAAVPALYTAWAESVASEIETRNPEEGRYAPEWNHALRWAASVVRWSARKETR